MNAQAIAKKKILDAAKNPRYLDDLCQAGVVGGEFGLTQWGAMQLCKTLIKSGCLVVRYDSLNVPRYKRA